MRLRAQLRPRLPFSCSQECQPGVMGRSRERGRRTSFAGAVGGAWRIVVIISVCCPEDLLRFAEPAGLVFPGSN